MVDRRLGAWGLPLLAALALHRLMISCLWMVTNSISMTLRSPYRPQRADSNAVQNCTVRLESATIRQCRGSEEKSAHHWAFRALARATDTESVKSQNNRRIKRCRQPWSHSSAVVANRTGSGRFDRYVEAALVDTNWANEGRTDARYLFDRPSPDVGAVSRVP